MLAIGILGSIIILLSWVIRIKNTKEDNKVNRDSFPTEARFNIMISFGTLILFIYSLLIQDPIFSMLNFIGFVLPWYQIYLWWQASDKPTKRSRKHEA